MALAAGLALVAGLLPLGYTGIVSSLGDEAPVAKAGERAAKEAFLQLPLTFEANKGQTDREVDFISRGAGHTLFLTPDRAVFSLSQRQDRAGGAGQVTEAVVGLNLVGSNPHAEPRAHGSTGGKVNYFSGSNRAKWVTDVANYGRVSYRGVYPGIDLVYYGKQTQLEYDFVVAPGVDPGVIAFRVDGGDSVRIDDRGDLVVSTPAGELRQAKPVIYQEIGGSRRPVDGSFVLRGDREVAFQVGAYDRSHQLVIDPVLDYSTFLGGTANDFGFGIVVGDDGAVYLGGQTGSATFPRGGAGDLAPKGARGSFDTVKSGGTDAYALKFDPNATTTNLNPDGTVHSTSKGALLWAAYLGGSFNDAGLDLQVGSDGSVYLAGTTASGNNDPSTTATTETPFPTTGNAYDASCGSDGLCNRVVPGFAGAADAFVARISANGSALLYSSYLGGAAEEQAGDETPYSGFLGMAVRGTTAYVTSLTFSTDFPVKGRVPQKACASCNDGLSDSFLSLVDTSKSGATSLAFSTYLGGKATDEGKGVTVDDLGNAYLTGHTFGNAENGQGNPVDNTFPVKSALQETYRGGYSDAYVTKINPKASTAGRSLVYSTFLGGGGLEEGWDIALQPGGRQAYVTGYTTSGPNPHPQTEDPAHPGACSQPANADGIRPFCDYATDPVPYFPTTTGPAYAGRASTDSGSTLFADGDAFLVKLTETGDGLVWSRLIGGPSADYGQGLAVDADGKAYVTGWTTCRSQDPILEPGDDGFFLPRDEAPPQFYVNDPTVPDNDGVDLNGNGVVDKYNLDTNPATFEFTDSDFDNNGVIDAPEVPEGTPTIRTPGEPAQTGVADCPSAANSYDTSGSFPGPNLNPGEPTWNGTSALMDGNNFDNHFNDNPTGLFVAKVAADGAALDYAVLLDGFGFDRGFDVAFRDNNGQREVYVTGRVGSCSVGTAFVDDGVGGHPVTIRTCSGGAPYPTTAGAYDRTYNGAGRDTIITKLVE